MSWALIAALVVGGVCFWPRRETVAWVARDRPRALLSGGAGRHDRQAEHLGVHGPRRRGIWPWGTRRAPRAGSVEEIERRAQIAEVVAVGLRAGLSIPAAWHLAIETAAHAMAGRIGAFGGPADRTTPDLLDRSLVLSDVSGTPAAEAASSAAHHLRRRALALRRRESLLAGPRSSMAILTLLPLAGPLVTLVIGSSPSEVYRGGGAAVSAAVGVALTLAGWWTSRRLLVRASRPAPLRSGTASPRVALDPAP